jgi:integrase/recombinase XerD
MISQIKAKNMQLKKGHVSDFNRHLKKKGMLLATTECYVRDVEAFMQWLSLSRGHFGFEGNLDVELYLKYLSENQKDSKNSVRRKLISLKQFFRFLFNQEMGQSSPVDEIPIPARDESLPDTLDHEQIELLIKATSESTSKFKSLRDRSILSLLAFEGLKAREIITLKWSDFLFSGKNIGSLKIIGNKARVINLVPDVADALKNYKDHMTDSYSEVIKKNISMFNGIMGRSGLPAEKPISRHGIKFMLYDIGKSIDIDKLNTELLRHFAINYHLNLGKSPEDIMEHFGLKQLGNIGKHARKIPKETDEVFS